MILGTHGDQALTLCVKPDKVRRFTSTGHWSVLILTFSIRLVAGDTWYLTCVIGVRVASTLQCSSLRFPYLRV